jgi:hypothetical protein
MGFLPPGYYLAVDLDSPVLVCILENEPGNFFCFSYMQADEKIDEIPQGALVRLEPATPEDSERLAAHYQRHSGCLAKAYSKLTVPQKLDPDISAVFQAARIGLLGK